MSENFDLLGDPIPEGFGKRGRPPHIPTQQNRCKVMLLQAIGWPDRRIANALSINKKTLKKHYFRELRAREEARDRVDGTLFARCFDEAQKGNVGAIKEFSRMLERANMLRVDFTKPAAEEDEAGTLRASSLGKKEATQLAAERAHRETPWGELLDGSESTRPH